jgi:hypothetical protein
MLNEFIEKVIVHEGEEREKRKAAELPQSEHQKPKKARAHCGNVHNRLWNPPTLSIFFKKTYFLSRNTALLNQAPYLTTAINRAIICFVNIYYEYS